MHSCMLKYAKKPEERCVPSYDKFREELYSNCSLLGSHDDYSISRLLHRESINMMTMSRDPVDRYVENSLGLVLDSSKVLFFKAHAHLPPHPPPPPLKKE